MSAALTHTTCVGGGCLLLSSLPQNHFGAILADPPWRFATWSDRGRDRGPEQHYRTMSLEEIAALNVPALAKPDCVLFLWACWPMLEQALMVLNQWDFRFKTCAFCWTKANASQLDMLRDDLTPRIGLGYWTRANTEICLLATRGRPKRIAADVPQAIIEPAREHSRKPDCVHKRIERLVRGPYLELFARKRIPYWHAWGDQLDDTNEDQKQPMEEAK